MKKTIITVILSLVLIAGLAQAETKNINLGIIEMPQNEYKTLKAMVAGKYTARNSAVQAPEPMENLGSVIIPSADVSIIRAMVAGTYTPSSFLLARQETPDINVCGVTMPQKEYETLKAMINPEQFPIPIRIVHHKVQ